MTVIPFHFWSAFSQDEQQQLTELWFRDSYNLMTLSLDTRKLVFDVSDQV